MLGARAHNLASVDATFRTGAFNVVTGVSGSGKSTLVLEILTKAARCALHGAEDLPGPGTVFLQVDWSFKAPVRPGDTITGRVEVTSVRHDKPITELRTTVERQDGVEAVSGTAVCYTVVL